MLNTKYYDKKGKEITLDEFSELFTDPQYRVLGKNQDEHFLVSTVWVGHDRNLLDDRIRIYETVIFDTTANPNDCIFSKRYETKEEALIWHDLLCDKFLTRDLQYA